MIKVGKRKCKLQRRKKTKPNPPPWAELPADVTANILRRLGAIEILESAQMVCTNWRRVCKDPFMWRVIDMRIPDGLHFMPYNYKIMCCHAVDKSQGQLIDINIEHLGTDELLFYIGERCNHLKCLRLAHCYISSKGLIEAVKKFPELEELHLFFMVVSFIDEDIENIGTSCPKLKSFTYCRRGSFYPIHMDAHSNRNALAVAKSMPNLHHLGLLGDEMNNEGLEAILNCCLHLESLDICKCFSIDLSGDLGKRCSKQIKNLRCPNGYTDGDEWNYYYDDYSSDFSYGSFNFSDFLDYGNDYDFSDYVNDYFPC